MHYLDHNATSMLRPEARAAMEHALSLGGNASSVHGRGRAARALIEDAREQVAAFVGATPANVIFTSGGTEANALALWSAVYGSRESDAPVTRLLVSAIEHESVLANARALAERDGRVALEVIPVTADGSVDLDALRATLGKDGGRALVAVMAANNETGVIQPIPHVAALAKGFGALLLVDAVQAAGKLPLDDLQTDYLALSAHKLGGPQGAGALIVSDNAPVAPLISGGGQERRRRAGTENVAAIAGFGAVAHCFNMQGIAELRDRFEQELLALAPRAIIFGQQGPRLANTSNFAIPGLAAETALMALDLDGVMVSSGSACSSGTVKPSHVLSAMGMSEAMARCALRVSFGWNSTEADVDAAIASLAKLVARVQPQARRAA
jgi:cysteine desulfurase